MSYELLYLFLAASLHAEEKGKILAYQVSFCILFHYTMLYSILSPLLKLIGVVYPVFSFSC